MALRRSVCRSGLRYCFHAACIEPGRGRQLSDFRCQDSHWVSAVGVDRAISRSRRFQRASRHSRQRHRDDGLSGRYATVSGWRDTRKAGLEREPSSEFPGAVVPGHATTVQIMVKDSKRYASTGGWGFGRFIDGKAVDRAQHETCFGCQQPNVKDHDLVFTRLAP